MSNITNWSVSHVDSNGFYHGGFIDSKSPTVMSVGGDRFRDDNYPLIDQAYVRLINQADGSPYTMRALTFPAIDYYYPEDEDVVYSNRISFICNNGSFLPTSAGDNYLSGITFRTVWSAHIRANTITLADDEPVEAMVPVHMKNITFNADLIIEQEGALLFRECNMLKDFLLKNEGSNILMVDTYIHGDVYGTSEGAGTEPSRFINSGFRRSVFEGNFLMPVADDPSVSPKSPTFDDCVFLGDTNFISRDSFFSTAKPFIASFRNCVFDSTTMFDFTETPSSVSVVMDGCDFSGNETTWFTGWTISAGEVEFRNCKGLNNSLTATNATILWCTDQNGAVIPNQ